MNSQCQLCGETHHSSSLFDVKELTGVKVACVACIQKAAYAKGARDMRERAAKALREMKGGYSASISEDCLIPDEDGPWILNGNAAAAIRALPLTEEGK